MIAQDDQSGVRFPTITALQYVLMIADSGVRYGRKHDTLQISFHKTQPAQYHTRAIIRFYYKDPVFR